MADRLILGSGYVGMEAAARWVARGDHVVAVTRSHDKAEKMRGMGIEPLVWDWYTSLEAQDAAKLKDSRSTFRTVLIAVSHALQQGVSPEDTHVLGLQNLWSASLPIQNATWIYLSTTGVYGEPTDSNCVDEGSPVEPTRPGAIAAWAGEQWCQAEIETTRRVVLRPAGIYGPDRVPNWQAIRDSVPLQMDPSSYLNLIHRDDLVSVIDHFANHAAQHSLYSVCDGCPPTRQQYYDFISHLGRWPSPVFVSGDGPTSGRRSRSAANKQVSAERLQKEFSSYTYPNYQVGLRTVLREFVSTDP